MKTLLLAVLAAASFGATAQVAPRSDTGPVQPPDTIARSMCEALAGVERDRCVAEQSLAPDQARPLDRPAPRRSCDELPAPEKDACLRKGGSIKAGMGATRPAQ